ncbi:hypothetical protein M885DRAFT_624800 [Pelagophyceae sp. CCMP2097]|nr:hypothetical protein M885DRAFT_624800 [Pelagophyceae sp. CCMP2097]
MPRPLRVDFSAAEQDIDSDSTSLEFELRPPSPFLLQRMPRPLLEPRALHFDNREWSSPSWGPPRRAAPLLRAAPPDGWEPSPPSRERQPLHELPPPLVVEWQALGADDDDNWPPLRWPPLRGSPPRGPPPRGPPPRGPRQTLLSTFAVGIGMVLDTGVLDKSSDLRVHPADYERVDVSVRLASGDELVLGESLSAWAVARRLPTYRKTAKQIELVCKCFAVGASSAPAKITDTVAARRECLETDEIKPYFCKSKEALAKQLKNCQDREAKKADTAAALAFRGPVTTAKAPTMDTPTSDLHKAKFHALGLVFWNKLASSTDADLALARNVACLKLDVLEAVIGKCAFARKPNAKSVKAAHATLRSWFSFDFLNLNDVEDDSSSSSSSSSSGGGGGGESRVAGDEEEGDETQRPTVDDVDKESEEDEEEGEDEDCFPREEDDTDSEEDADGADCADDADCADSAHSADTFGSGDTKMP